MPMTRKKPAFLMGDKPPTTTNVRAAGCYGIWEFSRGAWSLRRLECGVGFAPGDPPEQAGRFEGELIRKSCEPVELDVPVMADAV
jgi:hypothetical protein